MFASIKGWMIGVFLAIPTALTAAVFLFDAYTHSSDYLSKLFSHEAECLPRPEDAKKVKERRLREQEQKSRADFFAALPAFKSLVKEAIDRQYGMPFDFVLVACPYAIGARTDLIDSEIVPWAEQCGWVTTHMWGQCTQKYLLELSEKR